MLIFTNRDDLKAYVIECIEKAPEGKLIIRFAYQGFKTGNKYLDCPNFLCYLLPENFKRSDDTHCEFMGWSNSCDGKEDNYEIYVIIKS